jgi:hypothetical protein
VTVTPQDGSSTVTAVVGADGAFSTRLTPGSFHVVGRSPQYQGGDQDCLPDTTDLARIASGQATHVTIICSER